MRSYELWPIYGVLGVICPQDRWGTAIAIFLLMSVIVLLIMLNEGRFKSKDET